MKRGKILYKRAQKQLCNHHNRDKAERRENSIQRGRKKEGKDHHNKQKTEKEGKFG